MSLTSKIHLLKYSPRRDFSDLIGLDLEIKNARELSVVNIDEMGFTKINHETQMKKDDFWDKKKIVDTVYKECGDIIMDLFGADMTVTYQHRVRSDYPDEDFVKQRGAVGAYTQVHSDFTSVTDSLGKSLFSIILGLKPNLGKDNIQHHAFFNHIIQNSPIHVGRSERSYEEDVAEKLNNGTIRTYQFWRNIGEKSCTSQFALADSRSVDHDCILEHTFPINYPGLPKFSHSVNHFRHYKNSEYTETYTPPQFYYYPELEVDELILFKGWDSEIYRRGGTQWTCPHAAFETPNGSNLPNRWSIDTRTWAIWFD